MRCFYLYYIDFKCYYCVIKMCLFHHRFHKGASVEMVDV